MAVTEPIPPETDSERTAWDTDMVEALDAVLSADAAVLESDDRAWLALPGRDCAGGIVQPCDREATWELRGHPGAYCIHHAALTLRLADWTGEVAR